MLSVDIEDYFQVENFAGRVAFSHWDSFESRVEENTRWVLGLMSGCGIRATFFILGWVAEKYPGIVREIHSEGHEVACHSYRHRMVYRMSPGEFREDTRRAKGVLQDIIGAPVVGYRAPSFSITKESLWALEILKEEGFEYDSSIFPILHDRYGIRGSSRFPYRIPMEGGSGIWEVPISTMRWGKFLFPMGGGYFRLFPYAFSKWAFRRINRVERSPFVFYFHPWEIDPAQDRIPGIPFTTWIRHSLNIERMRGRLEGLVQEFSFQPIVDHVRGKQ
jgi:polysaccharide deacetylase family protein (PEP-CTERM system associated)